MNSLFFYLPVLVVVAGRNNLELRHARLLRSTCLGGDERMGRDIVLTYRTRSGMPHRRTKV